MSYNLDAVPPGFKILSERPELKIKYRYRSHPFGCELIAMLPWVFMFIISLIYIFYPLWVSVVNDKRTLDKLGEKELFDMIFLFVLFLALALPTYTVLRYIFGVTTFVMSPYRLTIDKELLGVHLTKNVLSADIHCFREVKEYDGDGNPYWKLELILTTTRKNYRLFSGYGQAEIDWLGRVLAEFYQVEFQSATNRE